MIKSAAFAIVAIIAVIAVIIAVVIFVVFAIKAAMSPSVQHYVKEHQVYDDKAKVTLEISMPEFLI